MSGHSVTPQTAGDSRDIALARFPALVRAIESEDWHAATAAVRTNWYTLAATDSEITRSLLERIPPHVLKAEPLLTMELGIVYNKLRFHRVRGLRYFATAVRAARSTRNQDLGSVDRLLIRSSESAAYKLLGRTGQSVAAARAAIELADGLDEEERASVSDLPRIYAAIGVCLLRGGCQDEALEAARRGLAEAPTTAPSNGMGALALLAGVHALRGDIPSAREHIEYARGGPWTEKDRSTYSGTLYRVAEATIALEAFDADGARNQLAAMVHGRYGTDHWPTIAQTRALIELVDGNPGQGLAELDAVVAEHGAEGRSPRVRAELARVRSLLQLALGNAFAASAIVERDLLSGPDAHIERARVALALGQTGTALSTIRAASDHQLSTRQTADAVALEAAVLMRIATAPRAGAVIERLGSLLERSQQRLALALLPPSDVARLTAALADAGFADLATDVPARPLLRDVEPALMLSERESTVLAELTRTASIAQISSKLVVSANTVKTQIRSIYRKLGVSNREDAIAVALERHLLIDRD